MRKTFDIQYSLGIIPIKEVNIPTKSRDELPPVLLALQYIYTNAELNEKVFRILEYKICKGKKKTGRKGMDLWEILVLAVVRLCLNTNYDRLHYLSNADKYMRQILGVETQYGEAKEYQYQNIVDNISQLDEDTLYKINEIVVEAGHKLFKKKEDEPLRLKADSYVVESNVHFPTDYNLMWDSGRKCCDLVGQLIDSGFMSNDGWRKLKYWRRSLKNLMRTIGRTSTMGGKNKAITLQNQAKEYIKKGKNLSQKVKEVLVAPLTSTSPLLMVKLIALQYFHEMLEKHIDLVERRLIRGETIPANDKIYSIFETYTEWINKGKTHPNVELGKKLLTTTDQWGFIVDYQIVENQADVNLTIPLVDRLLNNYHYIQSLSFDRGFYKKEDKELLSLYIPDVIMPKRGKKNKIETEEENTKRFKKFKNAHSAIESNINELEYNGLNRCPDRGRQNFGRYIGLGVLSYNLHKIGKMLQEKIKKKEKKEKEKKELLKRAALFKRAA